MATSLTLRLYRAEYNADFVKQIECGRIEGLTAVDGNETVVVIEGTYETLEKLMGLMFVFDPELLQDAFPSFRTVEEIEARIDNDFELAFFEVQNRLLDMFNASRDTNYLLRNNARYVALYDAWQILNDLNK